MKDCLVKEFQATNTDNTNRVNIVSSSVNAVSSFLLLMFTPINVVGSSYENLGRSIPVNAATFPNDDFPTDPLMLDLEDTADLQVTGIFSGAYDDEDVGAEADLNNLETTMSTLVDLPKGKRAIGTKWVYRNKEDDIIFGSIKKSLCVEFEGLMHKKFQMSSMGELTFFLGLQAMQRDDGIFISQDKYVADILKKFDFSLVKTASTPIKTYKALLKDEEAEDVDVHLYRSMIGSLMYLTTSRLDIMFTIYACARFQVTPKVSHLHTVKRIFRYLKGQPKLGLWYPRDSPFDLEAFSNSDYARASLDKKSTIGGCQFLGKRLISWQCKKQTIVANSTTEVEYVVAVNCYGHVLWIQNQNA
ncbi:uncharacterized mitochondrial protein-like protein [Tanacetum coccineum]|uniref:Uncharacterized mitochondrial protein-like protein n=1 Tax=Tanacetum coccineum TaxID=301880 RepID=A0ABQ5HC89_9ASTR